jgi:parvulin-like peptidyl-prolyl isomerase
VILFVMSRSASAEVIDRVLAVVAGQLITLSDVTAARDLGLQSAEGAADPVREILSKLIDRELIVAEVDRYAPPEPGVQAIESALEEVRSRFATAEAFQTALAGAGMTEAHLRETLRQNLRIRGYYEQRFTVVLPGEDELGRYYRERADAFTRNGSTASFEDVRQQVLQMYITERRNALAEEWIAGLRRRADIVDRYGK